MRSLMGSSGHVTPPSQQMLARERASVCSLVDRRLYLESEPVRDISCSDISLYEECLARLWLDGESVPPTDFLPRIERLKLMRWFDGMVVDRLIQRLREHPYRVLGCNISGASAGGDARWKKTLQVLSDEPTVASRLVIEITESEPIDPVLGVALVRELQQLGCRVAVDDFGARYGMQTARAIRYPDIVKIDASFLVGARGNSTDGARRLSAMVKLARQTGGEVVIEGVETQEDLDEVKRQGIRWGQGYLFVAKSDTSL